MISVIMAGGSGTRFWPLSREITPKQYLYLFSEKTMIQETVERLFPMIGLESIYVVSTEAQIPLIKDNIPKIEDDHLIIEPFGKNTAPCVALSAAYLKRKYSGDKTMLILPSDHIIVEQDIFIDSIKVGLEAAREGNLVTFGIQPDYPATGYGYIEAGEKVSEGVMKINTFKEKPDFATAKSFLEQGNYLWNSGMFMWTIDSILSNFKRYAPGIYELIEEIEEKWDKEGLDADIGLIYSRMERVPVDIAIMEKADNRVVIPVNYHWNDVGSWRAVAELSEKDKNNNTFKGKVIAVGSEGNYVHSDHRLIALVDVENLVVVDTPDAILITKKESAERVKEVITEIDKKDWNEYL
ncbi:MAG: mannose-1-phosphate guanylyltransferase [Candidatus Cloacimonas sp.]|nr:mannose-1-phosphate guanylyltransferase [Candidatus Cloacimonadota bacterium]